MPNMLYLTSRLDSDHGGLTASLLNKTRILASEKNFTSTILTFHLDMAFPEIKSEIETRYSLPDIVNIENINSYFRNKNTTATVLYSMPTSDNSVLVNKNVTEHYIDGVKVFESQSENNVLKIVRHFDRLGKLIQRDFIDQDGSLFMKSHYQDNVLLRQVIYKKDQSVCLVREFDFNSEKKDVIKSVVLFNSTPIKFDSFDDFKIYFVEQFLNEAPDITHVIAETRAQYSVVLNLSNPNVRKISMTHSIHIRPETDIIRAGNRTAFSALNKLDALVVLTRKQRDDIVKRFGPRNNYYVIPHSTALPKITEETIPLRAVIVSRLHKEKRLDHAISAFKRVVDTLPDATLYIYGEGDERNTLQELIDSLGLTNNVMLAGYTTDAPKMLQQADVSLLTSHYEGFALVIQESIANGTPVIAYDIKYGPSDMIDNAVNGYLVPNGNIEKLSDALISYFKQSMNEKHSMHKAAIQKASEFSHSNFADSWEKLFNDTTPAATVLPQPTVSLAQLQKDADNSSNYNITLDVQFPSDVEDMNINFDGIFHHRSTLENKETAVFTKTPAKVLSRSGNKCLVVIELNSRDCQPNEIYDLSLAVYAQHSYYQIRIGNNRTMITDKLTMDNLKTEKIDPYFTKPYDNLSFKINS